MKIHIPLSVLLVLFLLQNTQEALAQTYTPGESYTDSPGYIEYLPGNLPLVISVPHGGADTPEEIPDRDCSNCVYGQDLYTLELARETRTAIFNMTGYYPHIVINLLNRTKLDANRDIGEAADGNEKAEEAWYAYQNFIDVAKQEISDNYNHGIFFDLHGHAHNIQRIELGYILRPDNLRLSDEDLSSMAMIGNSSIRNLAVDNLNNLTHAELVRGDSSFGSLLASSGYPAVPSATQPYPLNSEAYYNGGYNTYMQGSINGGTIDAIQIECNRSIRIDATARKEFSQKLASCMIDFVNIHYAQNAIVSTPAFSEFPDLKVFPNPARDMLHVHVANKDLGSHLYLYSIEGKLIDTRFINSNDISMDISDLTNGLYFLHLDNKVIKVSVRY